MLFLIWQMGYSQRSETKESFSRIKINSIKVLEKELSLIELLSFLHTNQIFFISYAFFVILGF